MKARLPLLYAPGGPVTIERERFPGPEWSRAQGDGPPRLVPASIARSSIVMGSCSPRLGMACHRGHSAGHGRPLAALYNVGAQCTSWPSSLHQLSLGSVVAPAREQGGRPGLTVNPPSRDGIVPNHMRTGRGSLGLAGSEETDSRLWDACLWQAWPHTCSSSQVVVARSQAMSWCCPATERPLDFVKGAFHGVTLHPRTPRSEGGRRTLRPRGPLGD